MPTIDPFEHYTSQYEDWFSKNEFVYKSEVEAVRALLPDSRDGIEVGVGSGLFATPLGINLGVEPSPKMRELAQARGVKVVAGVAEALPFNDSAFDFILMVTTVCFLDDIDAAFKEAYRVLRTGGSLVVGFVDRDSPVGRLYERNKSKSVFYRTATFYTTQELTSLLEKAGFAGFKFVQTIFGDISEIRAIQPVKEGHGEGSFVVIRAIKAMHMT